MRKIELLKERFETLKAIKLKDVKELDQKEVEKYLEEFAQALQDTEFSHWEMKSVSSIKEYLLLKYTFEQIIHNFNHYDGPDLREIAMGFWIDRCKDYNSSVKTITEALDIVEEIILDYNNSVAFDRMPYLDHYYQDIEKMFQKYEDTRISKQKFRQTDVYKKYFKNPLKHALTVEEIQKKQFELMEQLQKIKPETRLVVGICIRDEVLDNIYENICFGKKLDMSSKIEYIQDMIKEYPNRKNFFKDPFHYELEWRLIERYSYSGLYTTEKNHENLWIAYRGY